MRKSGASHFTRARGPRGTLRLSTPHRPVAARAEPRNRRKWRARCTASQSGEAEAVRAFEASTCMAEYSSGAGLGGCRSFAACRRKEGSLENSSRAPRMRRAACQALLFLVVFRVMAAGSHGATLLPAIWAGNGNRSTSVPVRVNYYLRARETSNNPILFVPSFRDPAGLTRRRRGAASHLNMMKKVFRFREPLDARPDLFNLQFPEEQHKLQLVGTKVCMTTLASPFDTAEPVTLIRIFPATICRFEDFGLAQCAYGLPVANRRFLKRPHLGRLLAVGANESKLRRLHVQPPQNFSLGQRLDASSLLGASHVDVTSRTKGHGFSGVMARHGFKGSAKTEVEGTSSKLTRRPLLAASTA
eukprot:GHVT01100526.1.p1 GENE.GHVT01100526.1~~GHVT01100526.1.p1  ORF type:complete len:359 (-),score=30.56 GHVT01100526.1:457-1533(-)